MSLQIIIDTGTNNLPIMSEWLLFNSNEQFFSYITARTSYFQWNDDICFVLDLAHWNNRPKVDMSLHSHTLFWFQDNQSLLLLLNAACLAEKQQIPILSSLVWPDQGSNHRSTTLEPSMLTITLHRWCGYYLSI